MSQDSTLHHDSEPAGATPVFLDALRAQAIPWLRTYPHVKVWFPEFTSDAEVYSAASLLGEASLLERARIYATVADAAVLASVQHETAEHARFVPALRERVTFAQHDLQTDASFNEFQLIVCGAKVGSLDAAVKRRAFEVCHASLCRFGILSVTWATDHDPDIEVLLHGCYERLPSEGESTEAPYRIYRRIR